MTTKERPILMSTPMARAIREGRKTETRRPIKFPSFFNQEVVIYNRLPVDHWSGYDYQFDNGYHTLRKNCPYGKVDDILWVRETWGIRKDKYHQVVFKAGDHAGNVYPVERWKPSIHLKKDYARIWLKVTYINVDRIADITEASAKAEGVDPRFCNPPNINNNFRLGFFDIWQQIYKYAPQKRPSYNPLVWVVTFEVLSTNGRPQNLK